MKPYFKVMIGNEIPIEYDIFQFSDKVFLARLRLKKGVPSGTLKAVSFHKNDDSKWVSSNQQHIDLIKELETEIRRHFAEKNECIKF